MGDLTPFEALAGGAFDHLNCQHTREFDQNFSRVKYPEGAGEGMGGFGIDWYIIAVLEEPRLNSEVSIIGKNINIML